MDPIVEQYFQAALDVLKGEDPVFPSRQRPVRGFDAQRLDNDAHRLLGHNHEHAQGKQKVMENPTAALKKSEFVSQNARLGRAAGYSFDIGGAMYYSSAMRAAIDDKLLMDTLHQIASTALKKKWTTATFCNAVQLAQEEAAARQENIL